MQFLSYFGHFFEHFLLSAHLPWVPWIDVCTQVCPPENDTLKIGMLAGSRHCRNPKNLKIRCFLCVFVISRAPNQVPRTFAGFIWSWTTWYSVELSWRDNGDKMETVVLWLWVVVPQNMQFCLVFGPFLTTRRPHRPATAPTNRCKYDNKSS